MLFQSEGRRITEKLDVFYQLSWQQEWIICLTARRREEGNLSQMFCFDNLQIKVNLLITLSCEICADWICVSWLGSGMMFLCSVLLQVAAFK